MSEPRSETKHITIRATTNEWDAPVGVYRFRNGSESIRRDGSEPITYQSRTFYPHAVVLVDGVLSEFDRERQPADGSGSGPTPCDPDCSWTGVDGTDVADPEKVWRCDGCGATGTSDELNRPAAHIGSTRGRPDVR